MQGIANNLVRYNVLYGDTDLINKELDIYKSITREEIREVAKKYLKPNQRVLLEYLPKKETK
jgi:predicted Zn-dependent peptidase